MILVRIMQFEASKSPCPIEKPLAVGLGFQRDVERESAEIIAVLKQIEMASH